MSAGPKLTGLLGVSAATAGVWVNFGYGFGLITAGGLLIADAVS